MRLLIFLFLFPVMAMAQIDTDEFTLTSDSTLTTRSDTAYWQFNSGMATFTRPNGSTKEVAVYEAKLIVWQGGRKTIPITSGYLLKKEYIDFLQQYRDQHVNEIAIITTALSGVRDRKNALVTEIQSVRDR